VFENREQLIRNNAEQISSVTNTMHLYSNKTKNANPLAAKGPTRR